VDGFHIYLGIRVETTPNRLDGFSVRVTIPIESTSGAVTAVTVSALSLASDGTSRIQVERNGGLEYVTVKPGMAANGFVQITPIGGSLSTSQKVVIGYGNPGTRDAR